MPTVPADQSPADQLPPERPDGPRRWRWAGVLGAACGSAVALLAADRPWVIEGVTPAAGAAYDVTVTGSEIAAAVVALGLVGLAGAAVLLLVGGLARRLAAGLLVPAGVGCALAALAQGATDPRAALAPALARATGAGLVRSASPATLTPWPFVAAAGGLLLAAGGVAALLTARSADARDAGRRPRRRAAVTPAGTPVLPGDRDAAFDAWNALSRGEDPT